MGLVQGGATFLWKERFDVRCDKELWTMQIYEKENKIFTKEICCHLLINDFRLMFVILM